MWTICCGAAAHAGLEPGADSGACAWVGANADDADEDRAPRGGIITALRCGLDLRTVPGEPVRDCRRRASCLSASAATSAAKRLRAMSLAELTSGMVAFPSVERIDETGNEEHQEDGRGAYDNDVLTSWLLRVSLFYLLCAGGGLRGGVGCGG
jgi:hypothetical protein